jgi:hypothetical protein
LGMELHDKMLTITILEHEINITISTHYFPTL